jgi:hypothetical protein
MEISGQRVLTFIRRRWKLDLVLQFVGGSPQ